MAFNALLCGIKELGGTAYLVGGAVIDYLNDREIKDYDIEVFGLTYSHLEGILKALNLPVNKVGQSFGVIKTTIEGLGEVDLSLPRTENKVGVKHTDFEISVDPYMTTEAAAKRRDLTINSIMQNLHTGEIIDHYNGLHDLKHGVIRHVDYETFSEDPLRVMRIMQLLPRKGDIVSDMTMSLCTDLKGMFITLPKERLFEEFKKLLLKADKPSIGFEFLRESLWLEHFPELIALIDCPQHPVWHPEGDVWTHTMMVLDNAAIVRSEIPEENRLAFMFAALLHDIGKPATTDPVELTAHGHAQVSAELAEVFMRRISNETKLIQTVCQLCADHMIPRQLQVSGARKKAWRKLHNRQRSMHSSLFLLGYLTRCDSAGRLGRSIKDPNSAYDMCLSYNESLGEMPIPSIIKGRHLISLGLKPSPEFTVILAEMYDIQMSGVDNEDELLQELREYLSK